MNELGYYIEKYCSEKARKKYNALFMIFSNTSVRNQVSINTILKRYGRVLSENGQVVCSEQDALRKLQKINEGYITTEDKKILIAYRELLIAVSEEGLLTSFLKTVYDLEVQEKEETIIKNKGKNKNSIYRVARFHKYGEWKKYKTRMLSGIKKIDVLDGWGEEYCISYKQVKDDGFYNVRVENGREHMSSEAFVNVKWNALGYRCDIITGVLGSGKTLLLYRVAENLLEQKNKNRIIFISARMPEDDYQESMYFLLAFLARRIKKKEKFIVLIDGLDELLVCGADINYESLFGAASYYNATLLINCRSRLWNDIRERHSGKIDKAWTTYKLDINEEDACNILQKLKLSSEIIDEIMQSPLIRLWVEKVILLEQNGLIRRKLSKIRDDYTFISALFLRLKKGEIGKYGLSANEWNSIMSFLQKAAVTLSYYKGQKVSLAACIDIGDKFSNKKLLDNSFVNEMLEMDIQKENLEDSEIYAFRYKYMENYFLIEELCQQLKSGKYNVLLRLDFSERKLQTMLRSALSALPADVKERITNMLNMEMSKGMIDEKVKAQMELVIVELNGKG